MKRLNKAISDNENQLLLWPKILNEKEAQLDFVAFSLGMRLANIAKKYIESKSKICYYKDLEFYKKAFQVIAKI